MARFNFAPKLSSSSLDAAILCRERNARRAWTAAFNFSAAELSADAVTAKLDPIHAVGRQRTFIRFCNDIEVVGLGLVGARGEEEVVRVRASHANIRLLAVHQRVEPELAVLYAVNRLV